MVIRLTQVVAACGGRGVPRRAFPRARSTPTPTSLTAVVLHDTIRYPPPPNPSARRQSRNHGCSLRGLAAVRNHDRLLRIQCRVRRKAQGDAERRKEDQAGNRCLGQVMERDRRLTGFARGQTDKPVAPAGFELNNPWRCEQRFI